RLPSLERQPSKNTAPAHAIMHRAFHYAKPSMLSGVSIIPATHFHGHRTSFKRVGTKYRDSFERSASSIPPAHESLKHFTDREISHRSANHKNSHSGDGDSSFKGDC
ncbi:hypothetical protein CDAR_209931, partial [Caerostris darwini]